MDQFREILKIRPLLFQIRWKIFLKKKKLEYKICAKLQRNFVKKLNLPWFHTGKDETKGLSISIKIKSNCWGVGEKIFRKKRAHVYWCLLLQKKKKWTRLYLSPVSHVKEMSLLWRKEKVVNHHFAGVLLEVSSKLWSFLAQPVGSYEIEKRTLTEKLLVGDTQVRPSHFVVATSRGELLVASSEPNWRR